jgi:hypothetical protein
MDKVNNLNKAMFNSKVINKEPFLKDYESRLLDILIENDKKGKIKTGSYQDMLRKKLIYKVLAGASKGISVNKPDELMNYTKIRNLQGKSVFPSPLSSPGSTTTLLPERKINKKMNETWLNNPNTLMSFNKTRNLQKRGAFPGPLSSPATLTMPNVIRVNTTMKPITAWKNANARSRKSKKSRKTRRVQRKH